jgi:hypothetical protein
VLIYKCNKCVFQLMMLKAKKQKKNNKKQASKQTNKIPKTGG